MSDISTRITKVIAEHLGVPEYHTADIRDLETANAVNQHVKFIAEGLSK